VALENRDPFEIFAAWLEKASQSEVNNPDAMTLATTGRDGRPSARMVLLKDAGPAGFVFYTNMESLKSRQLSENPYAALLFHWKTQDRQIRIEGRVEQVSEAEADAYFASRPRSSQLGAWASRQSQPLEGWAALEKRLAFYTAKFNVGPVPRPEFWSGFRLRAERFEFWEQGSFRLHRRYIFTLPGGAEEKWAVQQVYP
jgi:pyridoxamine 5'-phosphate oxidase